MALRVKTVEYVLPTMTGSLATGLNLTSSTLWEFPPITCSFPETDSRTFRSVMAEVTFNDLITVATNLSGVSFGISSGSSVFYLTQSYGATQRLCGSGKYWRS
jgi:hypothetical protein